MSRFLARLTNVGGDVFVVEQLQRQTDPGWGVSPPVDPGYGKPGWGPVDPGYDLPSGVHPGHPLPVPPVKPSNPIVLPPNVWPPSVPSIPGHPDNSLPPGASNKPIVIPPDPDVGISLPIVIPPLPAGVALLIALPQAAPKAGDPPNTKPAILVQSGQKPVLVYVSAAASPK
jgi:hypothetical protein